MNLLVRLAPPSWPPAVPPGAHARERALTSTPLHPPPSAPVPRAQAVVGVIAVCTLIFLPTFISILAVFTVVCIDLQLLSVMSLAGLNFNSISCISLLIALG